MKFLAQMELRKHLSLKSNYFRIVIGLLLLCVVVGIYGYYFPKKYLFECIGDEDTILLDKKTRKPNGKIQTTERVNIVSVYEYFFGLGYKLDSYDLNQCKQDRSNISCHNEQANRFSNATFNLDESTYSYSKKRPSFESTGNSMGYSFQCYPIKNALEK
jgi:hypothetical protein